MDLYKLRKDTDQTIYSLTQQVHTLRQKVVEREEEVGMLRRLQQEDNRD
jgi:hypothetical protein